MATYTKVNKDTATYTKIKSPSLGEGWFKGGWFTNWLEGILYIKVNKDTATYTKVEKE